MYRFAIVNQENSLQQFLQSYQLQAAFFIITLMIALLVSAELMSSLSMISLIVLSIFQLNEKRIIFRKELANNFKNYIQNAAWMALTIPFFLVLFTAIYSTEDSNYLLERLRIKIPFLLLPFAFYSIPSFSQKQFYRILYIFIILILFTAIGVLINYGIHFEEIQVLIGQGQAMPTPTNHIRYSLLVSIAIISGIYLLFKRYNEEGVLVKWLLLSTAFLFVFLHVLSVRSGLAVMYISLFLLICFYIIYYKKIIIGTVFLVILLVIPFAAYQFIPSFHKKIDYMLWDLKLAGLGTGDTYSDSERILSYQVATEVVKENIFFGVGYGDLRSEINKKYSLLFPEKTPSEFKMPHNQYLTIWVATGLLGLAIFLISLILILLKNQHWKNPLFVSLCIMMWLSFMVENTIETAVGVACYLLFILLIMNYLKKGNSNF